MFPRLQFHDCVPCAVRGVDRVHVGLHLRERQGVHPLLHGHRPRGQPRHPQPLPRAAALQLLRHGRR